MSVCIYRTPEYFTKHQHYPNLTAVFVWLYFFFKNYTTKEKLSLTTVTVLTFYNRPGL